MVKNLSELRTPGVTERPEVLATGAGMLVGTGTKGIILKSQAVLDNRGGIYKKMACAKNPYGDGKAAARIVKVLLSSFAR